MLITIITYTFNLTHGRYRCGIRLSSPLCIIAVLLFNDPVIDRLLGLYILPVELLFGQMEPRGRDNQPLIDLQIAFQFPLTNVN